MRTISIIVTLVLLLGCNAFAAQQEISGAVEGVWVSGTSYFVTGSITVESGKSLSVQNGVVVEFAPGTCMYVNGHLEVKGEPTNPVIFRAANSAPGSFWHGLRIENATSREGYTEYLSISGTRGGIKILDSDFDLSYTSIDVEVYQRDAGDWYGAVKALGSSTNVTLNSVTATVHSDNPFAYVILGSQSTIDIINGCDFKLLVNNPVTRGLGQTIYFDQVTGSIRESYIHAESNCDIAPYSYSEVVGLLLLQCQNFRFDHNGITVMSGVTGNYSAAIRIAPGDTERTFFTLDHCSIDLVPLRSDMMPIRGVDIQSTATVDIRNTIFANRTEYSEDLVYALHALQPETMDTYVSLSYCDLYHVQIPENSGHISVEDLTLRVEDPMWDTASDILFSLRDDSPCIDAGDPDPNDIDPDGTNADIGMHFFYQNDAYEGEITKGLLPSEFRIASVYPNPFNSSAFVELDLPADGHVTVEVFNALGQQVAVLADGILQAGSQRLVWDGTAYSQPAAAGVYFVRASSGKMTASNKLLLLR